MLTDASWVFNQQSSISCRMLQLLNINNIALIDNLRVDFDKGLNLLTGETGSGKSIIVDALGLLIGGRFSADLLKSGADSAFVEGLFLVSPHPQLNKLLQQAGIDSEETDSDNQFELIVRRELSTAGRNKIFINNQLATQSLLKELRPFLVDIHGQGDQQTLLNPTMHLELLDDFAGNEKLCDTVADDFRRWQGLREQLDELVSDEAKKFQLLDTLKYQIDELERAQLVVGEDDEIEEERKRLMNVERLTSLSQSSYARVYEDDDAALARLRQTIADVTELAEYDATFRDYIEPLESARASLEDLAFTLREFADHLEFSPTRLAEIDDRLVELSRLKRKYGGSLNSALEHLAQSQDRLQGLERSDERAAELEKEVTDARKKFLESATKLHKERMRAARKLEQEVERGIKQVAMENGRFEVRITSPTREELEDPNYRFDVTGFDSVEFHFSANVGEALKPLANVASGGEASRLMLVLKTTTKASEFPRTIVFDEVDAGIGGRVSEAVGAKLKALSDTNQVLCVTHQAQIARFADHHLVVAKETVKGRTRATVTKLDRAGQVEEIARMLTGAEITDSARKHAKELLR
jgi:DNA repair protein RecN (Recombination protein N)